jgi:hypothetical protein
MEGPYVKTIAFGRRESLVPPDASIRHMLALPVQGIKHQVSWPPPTDPGKIGTNRAVKAESSVSVPMDGGGMLMIQPEWTVAKPLALRLHKLPLSENQIPPSKPGKWR